MIKSYAHQEGLTVLSIYAPNEGLGKYLKQLPIDLKEDINRNTW